MKKLFLLIVTISLFLISNNSSAQDPRFSQYWASPLTLNPALTGVIDCDYRLTGIYRNQWSSVLGDVPFKTYSFSFDGKIPVGKYDDFGAGISFMSDKAGTSEFATQEVGLNLSYLKALNNRSNHYLSAGFFFGMAQRSINYTNLSFGQQVQNGIYDPLLANGENDLGSTNFSFMDAGAGLFWYLAPTARNNVYLGISAYHFNQPRVNFITSTGPEAVLYTRLTAHGGAQFKVGKSIDMQPGFMLMSQHKFMEIDVVNYFKFLFEPRKPNGNAFYMGAAYRIVGNYESLIASDAMMLGAKLDYSNFTFGITYDFNFSDLTQASSGRGGFEVSGAYVGCIEANKRNKTRFCPRF